jgi:hypothetical protein
MLLIGVVALSVVAPETSDARPRVFGVLRALLGGVAGIGIGHHYYAHHRRHGVARSEDGTATATAPQGQNETPAANLKLPPPPTDLSTLPQANFAAIDDEFLGYVFWPSEYDTKFWAHGERDMIQAMFAKGEDAPTSCGQSAQDRAKSIVDKIDQAVRPNEEQHGALDELQSTLVKAFDDLSATCRDVFPLTPTERLKAMRERLYAIRNAGLSIRTPLGTFYDSLSAEQKTMFGTSDVTGETEKASAPARDAAQICSVQVQAAYAWPSMQIGRRVRPNQQQRTTLEALQKTLFSMAMYLNGACPKEPAPTPVARLDLAMRRLDAMLYAVIAIAPALDDFYGRLNDEQKARFNSINRQST